MEVKDLLQATKGRTRRATGDCLLNAGLASGLGGPRNPDPPASQPAPSSHTAAPSANSSTLPWDRAKKGSQGFRTTSPNAGPGPSNPNSGP